MNYFHSELNTNGVNRVASFPAWETDPYAGLTPHADIQQRRATALWRLRNKQVDIVVASIRSMTTRLAAPAQFDTYSLHVTSGEDLSQELLIEHLANSGYLRQEPVGAPGEFSVRGGIVDVIEPNRVQDFVCFHRSRQAPEAGFQQADRLVEEAQNILQGRPPSASAFFTNSL